MIAQTISCDARVARATWSESIYKHMCVLYNPSLTIDSNRKLDLYTSILNRKIIQIASSNKIVFAKKNYKILLSSHFSLKVSIITISFIINFFN